MIRITAFLALNLLIAALPAAAQTPPASLSGTGDATLHVLRPVIHGEQDQAELCLEFDHSLDPVGTNRSAINLKLTLNGKTLPITPKSYAIDGGELCLPNLEHRQPYHISLASLRSAAGFKLDQPYSLAFTVPPRHAGLSILNSAGANGMMRWAAADPVLRAVNIGQVKLELFRVADPAQMADAWSQRLQTTLAPSESATYARNHGSLVWQGALTLPVNNDHRVEAPVPLGTDALASGAPQPPGLYLLVASAPQLVTAKNILAPVAAAWLLRSSLHIAALAGPDGMTVTTDHLGVPMGQVRCLLLDRTAQIIAEARSDADGIALLAPPAARHGDSATVMGLTANGDADFADATQLAALPALPASEAVVTLSQPFYAPGSMVTASLLARTIHDQPLTLTGSSLILQHPDRTGFERFTVPGDGRSAATVTFPAPAGNGVWHLVWQQADGVTLAQTDLAVSSAPTAPHLEMSADRALLNDDGDVTLTLKSLAADGQPAPYIAGTVTADWTVPDHVFPSWMAYRFGTGAPADSTTHTVGSFVTDGKGISRLHLKLTPPPDAAPLHAVNLSIVADPAAGVVTTSALTLPMRPKDFVIGVHPLNENGRFAENSQARFDLIALDSDGKRRGADNLTWQIDQQGRSFDWHQVDGRWDYKPQPQQRRIGGGALQITADAPKRLEFPVTAGAYRLDINDADGILRARLDFSAGWGLAKIETPPPAALVLTSSTPFLTPGNETQIRFTLPAPALMTVVIADDKLRRILHGTASAGINSIALTPAADWGNRVGVWVTIAGTDGTVMTGQTVLSVGQPLAAKPTPIITAPAVNPAASPALHAPRTDEHDPAMRHSLISIAEETIAPRTTWQPAVEKTKNRSEPRLLFIAAQPADGLPAVLSAALARPAVTTVELAGRLDTLRLWHDVLLASGLLTDSAAAGLERDLTQRLLIRQQLDGGFAALPGGTSELAATAAALLALPNGNAGQPNVVPVSATNAESNEASRAALRAAIPPTADWLQHRLENTWFDEQERPARAAAYAALAAVDRLDAAGLRYFADTSADKNLPPVAAAQLAAAFARLNDRGQALAWLNAAHVTANPSSGLLAWVMNNPFADAGASAATLTELAGSAIAIAADGTGQADWLRAMAALQARAGRWQTTLGRVEITQTGVYVTALPAGVAPLALRNSGDRPLHALTIDSVREPVTTGPLTRRLNHLDGSAVKDGALTAGEVVVVTLEGPAGLATAGTDGTIAITDMPAPALRPIGCALAAPDAGGDPHGDFLGWLRGAGLTPKPVCEAADDHLTFLLPPDGSDSGWRLAYLAQVGLAGSYDLTAPIMQMVGAAAPTQSGAALQLHIH